ncbi:MAG: hypothetical protein H7255_14685, partial [Ramlibacter sp.]|nr:hypothetical protein [Ramlibacter sp.]
FDALDSGVFKPNDPHVKEEIRDVIAYIDTLGGSDRITQLAYLRTRLEKRSESAPWFVLVTKTLLAQSHESDLSESTENTESAESPEDEAITEAFDDLLAAMAPLLAAQKNVTGRQIDAECKVPPESAANATQRSGSSENAQILSTQIADYADNLANLVLDCPDLMIQKGRVLVDSIAKCSGTEQVALFSQMRDTVESVCAVYPPIAELLDFCENPFAHAMKRN